jgi:hypothetical protein
MLVNAVILSFTLIDYSIGVRRDKAIVLAIRSLLVALGVLATVGWLWERLLSQAQIFDPYSGIA